MEMKPGVLVRLRMKDERIKEYMIQIGHENSISLYSTLKMLINEVEIETRKDCIRIIEQGGTHKDLLWGR
jgi:hypothetical protein